MKINLAKLSFSSTLLLATSFLQAAEIPSNDIAVFSLEAKGESYQISDKPFHLTYRDGYDNQPKFSDDGKTIYFTRALGNQTDIMSYSFADKRLTNVTQSDDLSEYSATPYQSGALSIIRVNQEGKQHLASLSLETGLSTPFSEVIEPIGYHAWLNAQEAPVFVLGDVMTLQVLNINHEGRNKVLASNIGRCFERISENKVSFSLDVDGLQHIQVIDQNHNLSDTGIVLPEGVQDYVWLGADSVLVGSGSKLLEVAKDKTTEVADLSTQKIKNISRLAYNSSTKRLAVVYER